MRYPHISYTAILASQASTRDLILAKLRSITYVSSGSSSLLCFVSKSLTNALSSFALKRSFTKHFVNSPGNGKARDYGLTYLRGALEPVWRA